jgi:8-oxo-dGTP diphosphatase
VKTVVVIAAVIEHNDCFFLTRRQPGVHLEGCWEFPGGKCEANETYATCLARELREELDVDARVGEEVFSTTHAYPDRVVQLHFLRCELFGDPAPQFGQEMRWVPRAELASLAFPPADAQLIKLLTRRD